MNTITKDYGTLKQRKWLSLYIKLGNATEAAMRVYRCKNRNVARSIGSENLAKLDYSEFLEEAGITDAELIKDMKEGRDATKLFGKNAKKHPDYATRHRYLETILKLKKRLVDQSRVVVEQKDPFILKFTNPKDEK